MLTGILIIAAVSLLAVLSHRRSRLENKIYRNVPVNDWLTILVFPIIIYIGWFIVVKNILERPRVFIIPLDDIDILAITILFMVYFFVGNSIHFTAKILWRYLHPYNHSMAYKVNEMFHGKLSHYLVYLSGVFVIYLLSVLELNHPVTDMMKGSYLMFVGGAGLVLGVSVSKSIFYTNEWFGGYNKPLFFILSFLFSINLSLDKFFQIDFNLYPVNLFVTAMGLSFIAAFIIRQLFIFSRLNTRRRLRFLAKILSA